MAAVSSKGRCAGCGNTGSLKAVRKHVMTCKEFITLFKSDRAKALTPDKEFARWSAEENSAEARMDTRLQVWEERNERNSAQDDAYRARYKTPPDPFSF